MKAAFDDTEKFMIENFAHTKADTKSSFNQTYRIDADRVQIEELTGKSFDLNGALTTNHLMFIDNGFSITFFRMFLECFQKCKCGVVGCENSI